MLGSGRLGASETGRVATALGLLVCVTAIDAAAQVSSEPAIGSGPAERYPAAPSEGDEPNFAQRSAEVFRALRPELTDHEGQRRRELGIGQRPVTALPEPAPAPPLTEQVAPISLQPIQPIDPTPAVPVRLAERGGTLELSNKPRRPPVIRHVDAAEAAESTASTAAETTPDEASTGELESERGWTPAQLRSRGSGGTGVLFWSVVSLASALLGAIGVVLYRGGRKRHG